MALRFQCGVIGMAETYASEGALEAGEFLRKGHKGRAPPFKEDMGSEGILLIGEAMHQCGIIQDRNGDLEGRNDSRDLMSIVDSLLRIVRNVNSHSFRVCLVSSALTQMLGAKVRVKRCLSAVGSVADTTVRQ